MKFCKILSYLIAITLVTSSTAVFSIENTEKLQLQKQAIDKILKGKINLKTLLNNESNDLIIEYNVSNNSVQSISAFQRSQLADEKKQITGRYNNLTGVTILRDYNGLPITAYRISNRDSLIQLLNDPNIKAIYPNIMLKASMQESLPLINQPQAVGAGFDGMGTSVAVLDSGVDYRHGDFGNCTAVNTPASCRVIRSFDAAQDDGQLDDSGHGTNVSGIIANVAPKTKLIVIDVFTYNPETGEHLTAASDAIAAINWVINNAQTYNIKAMNLSLGTKTQNLNYCENDIAVTPFAQARKAGVVPVVAAGNEGFSGGIASPACAPGAVSVGAVYDANMGRIVWDDNCIDNITTEDQITCFSNRGPILSLLAPGSRITAGGLTLNGTSQAAPHVAGLIAILRADNVIPAETIDQTVARLQKTGKLITDPITGHRYPRVDIYAAINGLQKSS